LNLDPSTTPSTVNPETAELPAIREALANRLNDALTDPLLFQKIDVSRASNARLKRVKKKLAGSALATANAALLRECYPEEMGSLALAFYNHAIIQAISKGGTSPSYISSDTFSTVLTDILGQREGVNISFAIANLPEGSVKQSLMALVRDSNNDFSELDRKIQSWFDNSMDRVSGWYKRKTQLVTVIVAAVITVWSNADTVSIRQRFLLIPPLRQKIVQDSTNKSAELTSAEKADLSSVLGWDSDFRVFHRLKNGDQAPPDDSFPGKELVVSGSLFLVWL